MNILVYSWRDPKHSLAGGAEQVMHQHMLGWVEAGHNVTLFSSKSTELPATEILDGVNIIRQGNQYHLGVQIAGFFYYFKNKKSVDLVVDQFHGLPFFTPLYVRKPIIAVVQETAREVWFLNPFFWPINWIYGLAGYLLEPLVYKFYKNVQFITGSKSAKEDVVKMGIAENKIKVIPHGVIVKQPRKDHSKEGLFTIVYLGVLSKDKGIEDALEVFKILDRLDKFQFWVIGKAQDSSYGKHILQKAKKINFTNRIKFWGFVSQDKKFELLSRSHILINTSVREGWGLVNIEANSMGTPVVAYSSRGLVDSVKNGKSGVLCSENSPEFMAKTVLNIAHDQENYKHLSVGATKWSRQFSWKKSRKASLDFINKICNEQ